ncbi:MAG: hypothetical protein RL141_900 [Candidatus Parcubacteria bacterium]|jgi:carbamoyltransferase
MKILGLSFFYHDAAACVCIDGVPVAMAEEERFSRIKHDSEFPAQAVAFALQQAGLTAADLDAVVFYEKPFVKFDRIIKSALATFPYAPRAFAGSMKLFFTKKMWIRGLICTQLGVPPEKVFFSQHHLSHQASAFFCSPWQEAAILTVDAVGEWDTTSLAVGKGNNITLLKALAFPHSLGMLYSAFTAFLGFEVNEGEYKVMGMAPYGTPKYVDRIWKMIRRFPDGSFELDLRYFAFQHSVERPYSRAFLDLFGPARNPASKFFTRNTGWPSYFGPKPEGQEWERMAAEQEFYADVAASVQRVLEELILGLARHLAEITGLTRVCLAGGVALNSVSNTRIARETPFTEVYIQPAAGDAGGALGAALAYEYFGTDRPRTFHLRHALYGKAFSNEEVEAVLQHHGVPFTRLPDDAALVAHVAERIADGKVIGWFQGRFEWGPRALGSRSILADPRRAEMKDVVNTKIKFREPYRPFAPSVLAERAAEYFIFPEAASLEPARFMLYVVPVRPEVRSRIPAVTHVDGSARPQLVTASDTPRYEALIRAFEARTGVPVVLDTSFNLKGEPIVTTPQNALRTFLVSEMDVLAMEHCVVERSALTATQIAQVLQALSGSES